MQYELSLSKRIPIVAKVKDDKEEEKPVDGVVERKIRTWITGYTDVT